MPSPKQGVPTPFPLVGNSCLCLGRFWVGKHTPSSFFLCLSHRFPLIEVGCGPGNPCWRLGRETPCKSLPPNHPRRIRFVQTPGGRGTARAERHTIFDRSALCRPYLLITYGRAASPAPPPSPRPLSGGYAFPSMESGAPCGSPKRSVFRPVPSSQLSFCQLVNLFCNPFIGVEHPLWDPESPSTGRGDNLTSKS